MHAIASFFQTDLKAFQELCGSIVIAFFCLLPFRHSFVLFAAGRERGDLAGRYQERSMASEATPSQIAFTSALSLPRTR